MILQFSIVSYFLMGIFYTVAVGFLMLLWLTIRHWKNWKFVITPLAVIFLILPWVDEVWIAWHFHELCKDAGVHVYKKVKVEGFLDDTHRATTNFAYDTMLRNQKLIEDFKKDGYAFRENMFKDGRVSHRELVDDGVKRTIIDQPQARYIYKYSANNKDAGLQLEKQEWVVVDSATGEVLGRDTTFKRYPSWFDGLWLRYIIGAHPTICKGPYDEPEKQKRDGQLYKHVLIPKS